MTKRQIAIFGGSFNPPTVAHGAIIRALAVKDTFDEVWIMPSKSRSDKAIGLSARTRTNMIKTMIAEEFGMFENILFSDFELKLPGKTQTAQTLRALAKRYPECEFTMVIGEDSLATMPQWEEGRWLLENGRWLIVPRVEKEPVQELPQHISYLPLTTEGISSTRVRNAVRDGASIRTLVYPAVETLITEGGYYRA